MRFHNSLPVPPDDPVGPVAPVPPDDPVGPVPPVPPVGPPGPVDPVFPIGPVDPVCPVWPVEPIIRKEIVRQTSVRVIKNCHHFLNCVLGGRGPGVRTIFLNVVYDALRFLYGVVKNHHFQSTLFEAGGV